MENVDMVNIKIKKLFTCWLDTNSDDTWHLLKINQIHNPSHTHTHRVVEEK